MLCIAPGSSSIVSSHINTGTGERINSTNQLKILGFNFNTEPNAVYHVTGVIEKLYSRLWTLRFLKKSGMPPHVLLRVFNTVLRPAVEYSSVVYHSLIPEYLSIKLEQVQKQAYKIIYGWDVDYNSLVNNGAVETLKERREVALAKFANKAANSPRFGPEWFQEVVAHPREVRTTTRNKYVGKKCKTERGKNNPVQVMTRICLLYTSDAADE